MAAVTKLPWTRPKNDLRVAVLGDLILDEYIDGQVSRISPEAPVPVSLVSHAFHRAGGAANAALNAQHAGGQALLLGVWGDDVAARDLDQLLRNDGVETQYVVTDNQRPTTRKTRITANRQQIVRVDWEKVLPISPEIEARLKKNLESANFNVLLISDYGKGSLTTSFVQTAIAIAKTKKAKVIIDPKGSDYERYRGAFLITPNRKEACAALGLDPTERHAKEKLAQGLQQRFELENILITLGGEGMYLLPARSSQESEAYLPAIAKEVFDVSGAGDTVAAIFALGVGAGASLHESMLLSNLAASVVVGKWGTHPVEGHEIEQALYEYQSQGTRKLFNTESKVKSRTDIQQLLGGSQGRTRRVVFTNGCFDILHAGHVSYLEKARSLGDILVIGVNSDKSVQRLKGSSRPITPCAQRMRLLAALSCVDYVTSFDEDTPLDLIRALVPNVLVKGADWSKDKIIGADVVEAAGGSVDTIEFLDGWSTTAIIERIKSDKSSP